LLNKVNLITFQHFSLFLLGFTLLFKDQYSTIAMLLFIFTSFLAYSNNNLLSKKSNLFLLIPAVLVLPRIIGFFTGNLDTATNELIRSLPLLILFLPFIFLKSNSTVEKLETYFYWGLVSGIFLFVMICNYHVVNKMLIGNEPLEYFFRWRHLNVNYVKPIDTHPPYAGMIAVWVLIKTLYSKTLKTYQKALLFIVLALFLFQLLARNAIILAVIVTVFYGLKSFKLKYIAFVSLALITLFLIVKYHPHHYLREKFIYKLNPLNDQYKDKRVYRLQASYNVFKKAPLFGVGPKNDNELRLHEYKEMGYTVAYENEYNSHNQFFEYLVSHGLIGFFSFIFVLLVLFKLAWRTKSQSNLLVLTCFVLACLSESVLERTLGIKYFSIISLLIILPYIKCIRTKQINNES
tara:strand:+ start:3419 stop:4636 length:1218 start_codon:yes stop_codon:yes gene_type:complete